MNTMRYVVLGAAATLLATMPAGAQGRGLVVRAENTLAIERRDETISIPWSTLVRDLPGVDAARVRVRDQATGVELASQAVDGNGDGQTDELIFQASFWPRSAQLFVIEAIAAKPAAPRVHIKYVPERDDVAWENDRIAFRTYGQGLWKLEDLISSGIDVWPKRVRDLVVEKWYAKGHDAFHVDTGEGADFFEVGPTLGAGGTALWVSDSLLRAKNFKSYRIIAMGPVRAIFELQYEPVSAPGRQVAETKRFAIDAGQNLFRQESIFRTTPAAGANAAAANEAIPYAVGVVKKKGLVGSTSLANPWAWVTGWAPVHQKDGGHGYLGTAVLLEKSRVTTLREVSNHYVALTKATPGATVVHYVGAGWTDSGDFKDVLDWWAYLDAFAQRLGTPLKITVTP